MPLTGTNWVKMNYWVFVTALEAKRPPFISTCEAFVILIQTGISLWGNAPCVCGLLGDIHWEGRFQCEQSTFLDVYLSKEKKLILFLDTAMWASIARNGGSSRCWVLDLNGLVHCVFVYLYICICVPQFLWWQEMQVTAGVGSWAESNLMVHSILCPPPFAPFNTQPFCGQYQNWDLDLAKRTEKGLNGKKAHPCCLHVSRAQKTGVESTLWSI